MSMELHITVSEKSFSTPTMGEGTELIYRLGDIEIYREPCYGKLPEIVAATRLRKIFHNSNVKPWGERLA